MSGFISKIKIFPRLLFVILLVVSIPMSALWFVNTVRYPNEIQNKIQGELAYVGMLLTEKVDGWTAMNIRLLEQNALLDDIVSMDTVRQTPILKTMLDTYEWAFLIYIVGMDGFMNARVDSDNVERPIYKNDGSKAYYRGDRDYFSQVVQGKPFGQQVLLSRTLGVPAFILCTSIRNPDKRLALKTDEGAHNGALCSGMILEDISRLVKEVELGETGYAVLTDSKKRVITHGQPEMLSEKLQDFSQHPLFENNIFGYAEYVENGVKKVGYRAETKAGWNLIVEKDYDEAFKPLVDAKHKSFIFFGITITASLFMAYLASMRIARPIARLTKVAEGISKGQFSRGRLIESNRGDEIGALAKAIERMEKSIEIAFRKIKQSKE